MTETHLTPETHARLVAELEDLTTRGRVEIARQIEAARALGDLSENGDYHAAKDAQGKMESRVRQLQRMLEYAVIVDSSTHEVDVVTTGVVVELRYEGDDETETFLVGSIEEKGEGVSVISPASPLGQALVGRNRRRDRRVRGPERPRLHRRDRLGRPLNDAMAETLAEKVWDRHVVRPGDGAAEPDLLYIDLHLVHEVTSPQAFEGLRLAGRRVRRPDLTIATADHNVPTTTASGPRRGPCLAQTARGARRQLL